VRREETDMTDIVAMECREVQELMAAAVDGELAGRERAAFDAHVGRCDACAEELRRSRRLAAALRGLPTETSIDADFERAVLAKTREVLQAPGRLRARMKSRWVGWSARGLAAAAALVLAVGVWQRWEDAPKPPRPAREPRAEVPREVLAAPQRFLDMPVIERLEMLQYLQHLDEDEGGDGVPVERG
jgi:anti-sigma factor RsiW